jgi:hypothetical protein
MFTCEISLFHLFSFLEFFIIFRGCKTSLPDLLLHHPLVDVVLCSDTLYDEHAFPDFLKAIIDICTPGHTSVMMTYKKRLRR